MKRFLARHADKIIGVLNGFDRLVFRGTLRRLAFTAGLKTWLDAQGILLKDFARYAQETTARVKEASLRSALEAGRPVVYLPSAHASKEEAAREILEHHPVSEGLICVFSVVEPCVTYEIHRSRERKRLELQSKYGKCLHLYHYFLDPELGFLNARLQTWFPFKIQICLNGREWLARQMDRAGLLYRRADNCFPWLNDVEGAQRLLDQQLQVAWPSLLDRIARSIHPAHAEIFRDPPLRYYWSLYQSEWASDVMFRNPPSLGAFYPSLVRHAITSFSSPDVMRFLGRRLRPDFQGEVVSDYKDRPEGIRVKHRVAENSIKVYDKAGSILRVETTINRPRDFKVFRSPEGRPSRKRSWLPLRQGVADLHRRAQLSQASNERYLDALAALENPTPLRELLDPLCRPTSFHGRRTRGLRPWTDPDLSLLRAILPGEFAVNGLRNRDLLAQLHPSLPSTLQEQRRLRARVTRLLRLLRAHGLIRKLPKTHRYLVTDRGRAVAAAVLAASQASVQSLARIAA